MKFFNLIFFLMIWFNFFMCIEYDKIFYIVLFFINIVFNKGCLEILKIIYYSCWFIFNIFIYYYELCFFLKCRYLNMSKWWSKI